MHKLEYPLKCTEKLSGHQCHILGLGTIYFIFRLSDSDWYVLNFSFCSCVSLNDVV